LASLSGFNVAHFVVNAASCETELAQRVQLRNFGGGADLWAAKPTVTSVLNLGRGALA
jgi:hypothetical protein